MTIYGCRQQNNNKKQQQDNLANLEASLAPAEAEFGAVAKADQQLTDPMSLQCQNPFPYCFFIANNRFMSTFWKYLLHLSNPNISDQKSQKNKYLNSSTTSFFTFQSGFEKNLHQIRWFIFEGPMNNPSACSYNIGFWAKKIQNPIILRIKKLDAQICRIASHRKIIT